MQWRNTSNETVIEAVQEEIRKSIGGDEITILDPFCGRGSIPLEAERLGLGVLASDLNPVAVLITKALIEIPPKFDGRPPASRHPGSAGVPPAKGWYSRGYLPHVDAPGLFQSITFRLADSLSPDVLERLAQQALDDVERRKHIETLLDAGHGECWLKRQQIAQIVENALLHFDGERYRLIAWCIMPNHVHVLIETRAGHPLAEVVHSWKSFTAKAINQCLGRSGEVWQREYFDRYIRDDRHLQAAIDYIESNPVKAKLAQSAESWRFSSAGGKKITAGGEKIGAGGTPALPGFHKWKGAQGLAEDVRYYGEWMRSQAEERIGHLYHKVTVTPEMAEEREDLKPYVRRELTVIAWLWARTVKCPNPACGAEMPLVHSFWLSKKKNKQAWVEPIVDHGEKTVRFEVCVGEGNVPDGTVNRRGARCIVCEEPVPFDHVRSEGRAGRMNARLMAVVAEGDRKRLYFSPYTAHVEIANSANPAWRPEAALPHNPRDFKTPNYGMRTFGDLFTDRQLVALTTFSDLVGEARERVKEDAIAAGLADDSVSLVNGGTGAHAYADAVAIYLACAVSRLTDYSNTICTWNPTNQNVSHLFQRQAIPMSWDFAEANVVVGDLTPRSTSNWVADALRHIPLAHGTEVCVSQSDARRASLYHEALNVVVCTDPPYYDNIGYADLSDFFYVWLRRTLNDQLPSLFSTVLTPKEDELVATPYRFDGSTAEARERFREGFVQVFARLRAEGDPRFPLVVYYAFKQEENHADGTASTGWETMLDGLISAGYQITATVPLRTTKKARSVARGTNALASTIVISCRPRPDTSQRTTRSGFLSDLKQELPPAIRTLQHGNIAPVDLAQAAIGPGMAVFSRFREVLEADGSPMTVRTALALINQTLDEILSEQEADYDPDTRWALAWFEQYGFNEAAFGEAETLSKAKNTSVQVLVDVKILHSGAGKVRLLSVAELPEDWDPASDDRLTVWTITHQMVHILGAGGEPAAAGILRDVGPMADAARDLAYRLYQVCERKGWAREALGYNALAIAWPEIKRLAAEAPRATQEQQGFDFNRG